MTATRPFIKPYLLTAGPTPLPPAVSQAMAEPVLYHRAPAGIELYRRVLERLPMVFGTTNDVLTFAASGSGAMESAVANLARDERPVLVCSAGKFGERWIDLAEAFGATMVRYEPGWGTRLDPAEIDRLLADNPDIKVAFATLSETSTGIVHDIEAIAAVARKHNVVLVVDAVSGLGAAELRQDAWGVDVVVAGSQKALMCAPGLAFVSASQRALDLAAAQPGGRHYFDWPKTAAGQRKDPPNSPFTPAMTLLAGLDVALELIEQEGMDTIYARHDLLARAVRAGVGALGLDLYGDPDERSTVVTAIELPDDIDGRKVPSHLRDRYSITANGGQGALKGRILRIAHCGYFGGFDMIVAISGLEMTLHELGHEVDLGAGVAAAQRVFVEAAASGQLAAPVDAAAAPGA